MSDKIKWSELSSEQRDRLVYEKVMGLPIPCNGRLVFDPFGPASELLRAHTYVRWKCMLCDAQKECYYEDAPTEHTPRIPHYSTDMNAAMSIITSHKFMTVELEYNEGWVTDVTRWVVWNCVVHPYNGDTAGIAASTLNDALNIAALQACGVEVEV